MQRSRTIAVLVALTVCVFIPQQAHAQFGGLGKAIKKKATEAIKGTDSKADSSSSAPQQSSTSTPRSSPRLEISSDVLDRFQTALGAEIAKRNVVVKRNDCVRQLQAGPEYMNLMASQGALLEKIPDSASDEKRMQETMRIGAQIKEKVEAFEARKCGAVIAQMSEVEYEGVGAEAGGFTQPQYGYLKERIQPFCEGLAKGSSSGTDQRLMYSETEMAVLRPRCSTLLSSIHKTN